MNENFDPNLNPNEAPEEITMPPEELKKHKSTFSRIALSFFGYLIICEIAVYAIYALLENFAPELLKNGNTAIIISSVIQYCIALPALLLMVRKIPKSAPNKGPFSFGRFIKYALVSIFVMFAGSYISTIIMSFVELSTGNVPEDSVNEILSQTNFWLSLVIVGIIGPIVEELMFRKILVDRLYPYGEAIAVFVPALMFGLFHGNLYQFFYAAMLGIALSYIYIRSGKIIYPILLHIFMNMFCGILPSGIMSMMDFEEFLNLSLEGTLTDEYIAANALPIALFGAYELIYYGMIFVGIYLLTRNMRNIHFNKGEVTLPKGTVAETVFFNPGAIAFIAYCLLVIAISTFAPAAG